MSTTDTSTCTAWVGRCDDSRVAWIKKHRARISEYIEARWRLNDVLNAWYEFRDDLQTFSLEAPNVERELLELDRVFLGPLDCAPAPNDCSRCRADLCHFPPLRAFVGCRALKVRFEHSFVFVDLGGGRQMLLPPNRKQAATQALGLLLRRKEEPW